MDQTPGVVSIKTALEAWIAEEFTLQMYSLKITVHPF